MIQVFPDTKDPLPLGLLIQATRLEFECLGLSSPERPNDTVVEPSLQLYLRVRAAFILNEQSFGGWCRRNGLSHQNARHAVMGHWQGPGARAVVQRICEAAGVDNVKPDA